MVQKLALEARICRRSATLSVYEEDAQQLSNAATSFATVEGTLSNRYIDTEYQVRLYTIVKFLWLIIRSITTASLTLSDDTITDAERTRRWDSLHQLDLNTKSEECLLTGLSVDHRTRCLFSLKVACS